MRRIAGYWTEEGSAWNALLFAQGDFKKACGTWLSADQKTLMHITFENPRTRIRTAIRGLYDSSYHANLTEYGRMPEYFCLAGMKAKEARQAALASAAIPGVVTAPVIDGKIYVN